MGRTATVRAELLLHLAVPGRPSLPVPADVTYDVRDPWAVRMGFRTGSGPDGVVEWLFARSLLTEGVSGRVGEGDVRVWPRVEGRERVVVLAMSSPSGAAEFAIDRDALVEFLQETYLAVPTGTEEKVVDLDAELAVLLADRG